MTDKTHAQRLPESPAYLTAQANELFHSSFYKFVELRDPAGIVALLRQLAQDLSGSILIAQEGINGVVAGTREALDAFEHALLNDARFESGFAGMAFKRSACKTRPFARIKVHKKDEIVALGLPEVIGVDAIQRHGKQVGPRQWRELIAQDDVVVIDNRNSFEYRLGRFKGAIDPQVSNFRDFPKYIEEHAPAWRDAGTRVAMYCTGGIRCEKTGAWMEKLGLDVYELEGGILNYFQAMPDAEQDWEGECFVFDNRIALDTRLQETDTTLEDVYGSDPDEEWRLQRARRLNAASE
ncbi:rhodanese-like domain-containing protein [Oxalobacteraceae bacterium R-40]|uniref:tRNA uridine(34) hydroxylase n=1 Tax=Keguizhuia sedimenti TaxID=3064264 RepID=A0ABU1BM28_9BURK|nr:rhodanese-like domain-containing protein [Oxalobacteraceae bacterium R-40]